MKNIVIFGDSYSTHRNSIPKDYGTYYSEEGRGGDLTVTKMQMEDTWWYRFIAHIGGKLVRNDSWTGSTIGYTGYNNTDCSHSSSFIYRYRTLKRDGFFEKHKIDTVLVFGGTNDSWSGAPLGEMQMSGWKEKDLFCVLPAICYFADVLKTDLPDCEIIFIINTDIKEEIQNCIEEVAERYGLKSVRLKNISKESNHPTKKGMAEICDQLIRALVCPRILRQISSNRYDKQKVLTKRK